MGFDVEAYTAEKFEDRTLEFPVPDLKSWFGPEDKLVFLLRGLTGAELAIVREHLERRRDAQKLLSEAEGKGLPAAKVDAARVLLGMVGGNIPEEHARYIYVVSMGCVEPVITEAASVQLGKNHPIEFRAIAMAILGLTGQGRVAKKKP